MWLYKRRNTTDQTNAPTEINEYYSTQRRERRGIAWVLAFVTFIITLVLVLVLFLAGKWVYRKINSDKADTGTSQTTQTSGPSSAPSVTPSGSTQDSGTTNTDDPSNNGINNTPPTHVDTPQTSSTNTSTPSVAVVPTTPSTSTNQIPQTGPGSVVAISVVVAVAGAVGHNIYSRRRVQRD